MPDWKTHKKVAGIDGIRGEVMDIINNIIDCYHKLAREGRLRGISSEEAEWETADIVLGALASIEKEDERIEVIRGAIHHYTLDYIQKIGMLFLLDIAKKEGLKGARNWLRNMPDEVILSRIAKEGVVSGASRIKDILELVLEEWYRINEMRDPRRIGVEAIAFAERLKTLPRFW